MSIVVAERTYLIFNEDEVRLWIILLLRATSRVENVLNPKSAMKNNIPVIVNAKAILPNSSTPKIRAISTITMVVTEILVTVEMVKYRVLRAVGDNLKSLPEFKFS